MKALKISQPNFPVKDLEVYRAKCRRHLIVDVSIEYSQSVGLCRIDQWLSKCGPQPNSLQLNQKTHLNADSRLHRSPDSEILEPPAVPVLTGPLSNFSAGFCPF